jgi:hypothetical protein
MNSDVTKRIKEDDRRAFDNFMIVLICAGFVGIVLGIVTRILSGRLPLLGHN